MFEAKLTNRSKLFIFFVIINFIFLSRAEVTYCDPSTLEWSVQLISSAADSTTSGAYCFQYQLSAGAATSSCSGTQSRIDYIVVGSASCCSHQISVTDLTSNFVSSDPSRTRFINDSLTGNTVGYYMSRGVISPGGSDTYTLCLKNVQASPSVGKIAVKGSSVYTIASASVPVSTGCSCSDSVFAATPAAATTTKKVLDRRDPYPDN